MHDKTKITILAKPCGIPFQVDPDKVNDFLSASNEKALIELLNKAKKIGKNIVKGGKKCGQ